MAGSHQRTNKLKPKYIVRIYAEVVQTVLKEDTHKLTAIIEHFEDRTLGLRRIVIQEFPIADKRESKQQGFTDVRLLSGQVRTIATSFLKYKNVSKVPTNNRKKDKG